MFHFAPTCHARQATLALMLLSVLAVSGCGVGTTASGELDVYGLITK